MRARLAVNSADRMSRAVIMTAGLLGGGLVFVVGLSLARSSPYPTPREGGWVIEAAPYRLASASSKPYRLASATTSFQLASVSAAPSAAEPQEPNAMGAQAALEWQALTAPMGALVETPALLATVIPEPIWADDPVPSTDFPQRLAVKEGTRLASLTPATAPAAPAKRKVGVMEEVDNYLWEVYQRAPVKRDSTGDFTWKDQAAAKRMSLAMPDYVIRGMDADFREQMYHAGKAMDAAGINWSMLSAFRDDYRQEIASGFKARAGNSLHGGSRAVGGYGHGRAIDVTTTSGDDSTVYRWVDKNGAKYGLRRPMPGADPAHIQSGGDWHRIAVAMRSARIKSLAGDVEVAAIEMPRPVATTTTPTKTRKSRVARASHHRRG
jgi:hypothetical protein